MTVTWVKPLKFEKKTWDWVGRIEFRGSEVEVRVKCFDEKGPRNGAAPSPGIVKAVEQQIQKALDNYDRDLASIATSLDDLYRRHWKPVRGRNLAPGGLENELKLATIRFAQGTTRDQYQFILADPKLRFRSYSPQAEIDAGRVSSIGVFSPCDHDGRPLLPYLGEKHHGEIPVSIAKRRDAVSVPLTKQKKKFKWVRQLKYDEDEKGWAGAIEFKKGRIEIRAESARSRDPADWAAELLPRILACLEPASNEAVRQLTDHYNDAWVEDRELSVRAVKGRMELDSIEVSRGGDWAMWLTDGDLFGGHWIRVQVDSGGQVSFDLYG